MSKTPDPPAAASGDVAAGGVAGSTACFFDRKTLADHLLVSVRTLDRLDALGKLPQALRIGGVKRWTRASIAEWVRLGCPARE